MQLQKWCRKKPDDGAAHLEVMLRVVLSTSSPTDMSSAISNHSFKASIINTSAKDKQCSGRFITSSPVIICQN